MGCGAIDLVSRWCDLAEIEASRRPASAHRAAGFLCVAEALRPGIARSEIDSWEARHGYNLPIGLRAWLTLSNGLFTPSPLIHPLSAIGPMVPFAKVPGMVVQPESWFELGNPNLETVCIDLAYRWPGGGSPVFTSGDDERDSPPRLIGSSFEDWFLAVLEAGGREFWFEPGFRDLGDPWLEHRRRVPPPGLPDGLLRLSKRVPPMLRDGLDDRAIAARIGVSPLDVEAIVRHVQHDVPSVARVGRA